MLTWLAGRGPCAALYLLLVLEDFLAQEVLRLWPLLCKFVALCFVSCVSMRLLLEALLATFHVAVGLPQVYLRRVGVFYLIGTSRQSLPKPKIDMACYR